MIAAGTGHRPQKLGGFDDAVHTRLITLALDAITDLPDRPDALISGFALGWDSALADAALLLDIPLWAYIPFRGQEALWSEAHKQAYFERLSASVRVSYICEGPYAAWKMQRRNEAMVRDADSFLALWDGSQGGTANCIRAVEAATKPWTNLWERWVSMST